VHRRHGRVEGLGDLGRPPLQHIAEKQHRPLSGWQQLHGGHEREARRFLRLNPSLRVLIARYRQVDVRIRLQPGHIGGGRAMTVCEIVRHDDPGAPPDEVQTGGRRNPVEPRTEQTAPLEPAEVAPGLDERLLDGVLGVVEGAEHAVAVEPHPLAVRGGELVEGTAVATRGGVDQFGFGGHVSSPSPIRHARSSDVIGRGS